LNSLRKEFRSKTFWFDRTVNDRNKNSGYNQNQFASLNISDMKWWLGGETRPESGARKVSRSAH